MDRSIILTDKEINHKIKRIAFQIYENNTTNKEVVIAGIAENGFLLAEKLKVILEEISEIKVISCKVKIDKKNPLNSVETSITEELYKNKSLVLVDDVLNSGVH